MSAALAAGLSIMGTGLNKMITDDTNRQNAEIAAENRRWQTDMMKYQNEWNSPANQRKLYEEAGINPYMALGNFGDSTSADPGSSPTPPMEAPDLSAGFNSAASAVMQSAAIDLQHAQAEKARKDAESVGIDNQTKLLRDIATLDNLIEEARERHANVDYLVTLRENLVKRYEYESAESQSRTELNRANKAKTEKETEVLDLERRLREFDLKNLKPLEVRRLQRDIDEASSRIAVNYKSVEQMSAAIDNMAADTSKKWLEGLHQKYDNDLFNDTKELVKEQMKKNLGLTESQSLLNDAQRRHIPRSGKVESQFGPLKIGGSWSTQ